MTWLFFAIASVVAVSISNILQRVLMKEEDSDPASYSIAFQFICTVIVGAYALWRGFVMPPPSGLYLNFILGGVLYGVGVLFLFKALQTLESSEEVVITSSRVLITIITAILFLGESFSFQKGIGTVLILAAVILVSVTKSKFVFDRGVIYALAMALCFGLAVTNDAFILGNGVDAVSYTAIMFLLPGIVLLIARPRALTRMGHFLQPKVLRRMLLMCAFYSVAAVSFFIAIEKGADASQIAPINQAQVVMTVLLAAIILKERDYLFRKLLAAMMVLAGVLLIK